MNSLRELHLVHLDFAAECTTIDHRRPQEDDIEVLNSTFVIDAGETIEAIGGDSNVARAAKVTSEADNAAISVNDVVKDPSSAPLAILGVIMGSEASVAGK